MIKGGYPFYGQNLGILVFDQKSPRVPGDPGHASTFNFPVCYEVVDGRFSDLIEGSEEVKERLMQSVRNLELRGVKAIIGDCGLMALYQREMAGCSDALVLSSPLVLVPLIWEIIGRRGTVGIITGHSGLLRREHLEGASIGGIPLKIQGMEGEEHFRDVVIDGCSELDTGLMRRDVLSAVSKLIQRESDVCALLLECTNLSTYSRDVYEAFSIPVFDVAAGANLLSYAVSPPKYL